MKINWKQLIICVIIPLFIGGLAGFLSRGGLAEFEIMNKPPMSPPGCLFPLVWTVLYFLMGFASYLVLTSGAPQKSVVTALTVYGIQLAINFLWPILFFNLELYLFSFLWLVLLWIFILATIILFTQSSKSAANLMIPYLLWVTFAGYLNLTIFLLN